MASIVARRNLARLHQRVCLRSVAARNESTGEENKLSGFAKAYEKFETLTDDRPKPKAVEPPAKFVTLLRNSNFMHLGDPDGRIVLGKIFHVVEDDLYIDYGGKFHCICRRPAKNSDAYVMGAEVRIRLKSLELSTRFLGSAKDMTLSESDATLLGLARTGLRDRSLPSSTSSS